MQELIVFSTSSFITTDSLNLSPPCTSLWLIRCNKKAKKGKTQSRRNRRCGQEILWKRKISAIMGAEHLTMERGTGSL